MVVAGVCKRNAESLQQDAHLDESLLGTDWTEFLTSWIGQNKSKLLTYPKGFPKKCKVQNEKLGKREVFTGAFQFLPTLLRSDFQQRGGSKGTSTVSPSIWAKAQNFRRRAL